MMLLASLAHSLYYREGTSNEIKDPFMLRCISPIDGSVYVERPYADTATIEQAKSFHYRTDIG